MQMTRTLAAASIRISAPSKLLRTRNIGTLTVPEHPIGIVVQTRRNYQGMRTIQTPILARQPSPAQGATVTSGHGRMSDQCPLYPRKRISLRVISMSAKHAGKRPQRRPSGGSALRRFGASAFFNFETVNRFDPELLGLLGSRHGA